jgi:hypothetical protein
MEDRGLRVRYVIFAGKNAAKLRFLSKKTAAELFMKGVKADNRTFVSMQRLRNLYNICAGSSLPSGTLVEYCLDTLYKQVSINGAIIIDDYHAFIGCRKAVDEFREEYGITSRMMTTEARSESYWFKQE